MRRCRRPATLLAVLAVLGSVGLGLFAGNASGRGAVCSVLLRVDVFGGGRSWALQGGLNAGKSATLRAVARGCDGLDHITGRWVSGGSGIIPGTPRPCPGVICELRVRSNTMSAADFQAFARIVGGGIAHSNIVRVAWGGSGVTGTWTWRFAPPGSPLATHGTVDFLSDHTMSWSGGDNGTWTRTGNTIVLTWTSKHPVGHDTMMLAPDGRTMNGMNDVGWAVQGIKQ